MEHRLSRNDPCWCGSGKKYKHCHLKSDRAERQRVRKTKRQVANGVMIKTEAQIAGIRKSSQLTHRILDMLETRIEPGITTEQINTWVHEMTIANGAIPAPLNYRGFPKSTCTSINEVICHGIPSPDRVLMDGDILNVDVTCILDSYYGDSSRMYMVGKVSDEARKLAEVTRKSMYLGIKQVKPGNYVGDIGHAIQQYAELQGYSVVRAFVGHGTGIEFHEPPNIPHYGVPSTGVVFVPNMVFTIEPMINIGTYDVKVLNDGWTALTADDSLSAQWEHTVRVTDTGVEILT